MSGTFIAGLKVQRPVQSNICFVNFVKEVSVDYVVAELRKAGLYKLTHP